MSKTEILAWATASEASRASLCEQLYATAHAALAAEDQATALPLFAAFALLRPRDVRAWLGLAACSERQGEKTAALGLYRLGATLAPSESALCHLGRARLSLALGQLHDALEAFEEAESAATDRVALDAITRERRLS